VRPNPALKRRRRRARSSAATPSTKLPASSAAMQRRWRKPSPTSPPPCAAKSRTSSVATSRASRCSSRPTGSRRSRRAHAYAGRPGGQHRDARAEERRCAVPEPLRRRRRRARSLGAVRLRLPLGLGTHDRNQHGPPRRHRGGQADQEVVTSGASWQGRVARGHVLQFLDQDLEDRFVIELECEHVAVADDATLGQPHHLGVSAPG